MKPIQLIPFKKPAVKLDWLYLFSFLAPALIMLVIFVLQEIYPFGERSFLHIDMYHQYFPFPVSLLSSPYCLHLFSMRSHCAISPRENA